nr:SNF2-related protein [Candidatus Frankia nodulisporulans]
MGDVDADASHRTRATWREAAERDLPGIGALVRGAAGRFDPPGWLAAFLDALRWSAVTSADVRRLQAPLRSGVAVEDYQLEPVARAIAAPRVNPLLADDVGLGKTIEAGLVAEELLLRHRARRIMIVCPAGLTTKWRDEMGEKFGREFTIIDKDGAVAATVSVVAPQAVSSSFGGFTKPTSGPAFATFLVSFTAQKQVSPSTAVCTLCG